jgi:hypothetical protein
MKISPTHAAPVLGLVTDDAELPDTVIGYFNRLRRLPVGDWAAVARASAADGNAAGAEATLRRVVGRMPGLAAQTQRRVQNFVEVAASCLTESDAAAMLHVALGAALALATRPLVGEEAFTTLYAPFASLIPLEDLDGHPDLDAWGQAPAPLAQTA